MCVVAGTVPRSDGRPRSRAKQVVSGGLAPSAARVHARVADSTSTAATAHTQDVTTSSDPPLRGGARRCYCLRGARCCGASSSPSTTPSARSPSRCGFRQLVLQGISSSSSGGRAIVRHFFPPAHPRPRSQRAGALRTASSYCRSCGASCAQPSWCHIDSLSQSLRMCACAPRSGGTRTPPSSGRGAPTEPRRAEQRRCACRTRCSAPPRGSPLRTGCARGRRASR
jgi:hypothetical protein